MSATPGDNFTRAENTAGDTLSAGEARVFAAVQEYMAALESGRHPSRREFLSRYADVADELAACLDGLAFVHSAAGQIKGNAAPAEPPVPHASLAGAQPLGDFRLIREIGRGGMGVVYEAVQLSLGRRVALKVLPMAAALDSRHLERFRNEAQAAAQLHHTNIVPVYAVGCERSVHFYAMQLIEGQSLDAVIRDLREIAAASGQPSPASATLPADRLSGRELQTVRMDRRGTVSDSAAETVAMGAAAPALPSEPIVAVTPTSGTLSSLRTSRRGAAYARSVAGLGLQVAEALDYAHRAGIVHRDVKPANLLLDAKGTVWVTDFGLALFYADNNLTRSGDLIGTLRYMSPEQASGRAVVLDQRTDVYSLGVTLYELLTLERAFDATTHAELLHQVQHVDARPPRSIDRTVPRELEVILGKAMAKDPADRYQTAAAMAADLRRFLADEPILARPPSAWDKAWKWTRRHKAWALAGVAVLTLATVGLLVSTLLIAREQGKTRDAYDQERLKASEARAERAKAQQSWAEARDAVDFFTEVAIGMDRPQFSEVRRDMLEESLAYYQQFIDERRGDPSVAAALAGAQSRVSTYLELYGALDASVRAEARLALLRSPSIREDLKLTPQQSTAAMGLADEMGFGSLSPEQRAATTLPAEATNERRLRFAARAQEIDAALNRTIGLQAAERLRQISRQVRGPSAFSDPDVVERLGLTREQRAKVRTIQVQYRNAHMVPGGPMGDFFGDGGPGRLHHKFDGPPPHVSSATPAEAITPILAILTPSQSAAWSVLIGPPFTGRIGPVDVAGGSNHGRHGPRDDSDDRGPDGASDHRHDRGPPGLPPDFN